jgi:two-component system cell cycle response regulator DivK
MSQKTVLIVEDNELNLKLFRDLLEAHDIRTLEVRDGTKAVQLIEDSQPDLVLLDIQLPHISGFDISRELKKRDNTKHIPIIAVTAFAMHDDQDKILAAGCEGYMSKPISIGPFVATVKKFLNIA